MTTLEISEITQVVETEAGVEVITAGVQGEFPLGRIKCGIQPIESPDGSRTEFTMPDGYIVGTLCVYREGERIFGFTAESGTTFQLDSPPESFETLHCDCIIPAET